MSKESIERQMHAAQTGSMSLQWDARKHDALCREMLPARAHDLDVRPAGDGPLMQEFYAGVAREMQVQQEQEAREMWETVNRAQRGSRWRVWLTGALAGFCSGALGMMLWDLMAR